MIRFTCENCGQKIRTSDEFAGKRAKCPKCKTGVTIPVAKSPAAQEGTASVSNQPGSKDSTESWADRSDAEIVRELLAVKPAGASKCAARNENHSWLRPHYDEVTLFSMGVIFVLLLLISKTMRGDFHKVVSPLFKHGDTRAVLGAILLLVVFFGGAACCIIHAFCARAKSDTEKTAMLFFAFLVSGGIGMYAGKLMLEGSTGWLILFPIWNVIYGAMLLIKLASMFGGLRYGRPIDVSYISDRDASRAQVMAGLVAVLIILICCQFFFRLHWAVTFSICIAYTTSLDRAVRSVFGRR